MHSTGPQGAIRCGRYKLIEWFEKSAYGEAGAFELYNLVDDPGKQKDLALTHPEVTSELRQQLQKWRKQVGAQMMTKRNRRVLDRPFRRRPIAAPDSKLYDGRIET